MGAKSLQTMMRETTELSNGTPVPLRHRLGRPPAPLRAKTAVPFTQLGREHLIPLACVIAPEHAAPAPLANWYMAHGSLLWPIPARAAF